MTLPPVARLVSLKTRGALMAMVFQKSVRLSNGARERTTIGQVRSSPYI
jgi:hypothetical protein